MADSSSFLVSDLIASVTELSGGRLPSRPMHGAEAIRVEGFRPIEEADSAHIAFVSNPKDAGNPCESYWPRLTCTPKSLTLFMPLWQPNPGSVS